MFQPLRTPAAVGLVVLILCSTGAEGGERAIAQREPPVTPQSASSSGKFTVWVFRNVNGAWQKQEGRTLSTDDAASARNYVAAVNAVDGWTATSNLPAYEENGHKAPASPGDRLLGTRWTYFGSLEGCVFEFHSGNRLLATNFPQLGTWSLQGRRLTIEIQNPFCEGVNVYTGDLDELSRDIRLQVIRSPYPSNIGREVVLKRLPLPGFT